LYIKADGYTFFEGVIVFLAIMSDINLYILLYIYSVSWMQ